MPDSAKGLGVLREHGYRITMPRRQVLKVLAEAECPLSPYEIQEVLRQQGKHLNHVTIYRVLELLCALNLAHKVLLAGGFVICSLGSTEGCHRFVMCRECGVLKEYASKDLCAEETEMAQSLGFRAEQHFSEFSGVCARCQK
jgi:Fur family zinc uptake transcriptional regulator